MLLSLIRVYLKSVFVAMFARQGKRKKLHPAAKVLLVPVVLYVAAALLVSLGMIFMQAAQIFFPAGENMLYFIFTAVICLIFGVFGSVFLTSSLLFESKDNELLLSMPIPPSYILASRFSVIFIINYLYSFIILAPSCAVYIFYTGYSPLKLFYCIAANLVFPALSVVFCCIFGWALTLLGAGRKKRHIFELVLSLLFLFGYLSLFTNMQGVLDSVVRNSEKFEALSKSLLLPIHFYSLACTQNDISSLLLFFLIVFIVSALTYLLLSKTFVKLTSRKSAIRKTSYRRKELKASSRQAALIRKELEKYLQTSPYLLNCGLGIFISILLSLALFFKGTDIIARLGFDSDNIYVPVIICTIHLFCALTTNFSCVSLSLEGNRLYLLKSMPLTAKEIINSKIASNILAGAPAFVLSFTLSTARLNISAADKILAPVLGVCALIFVSCLGMLLNLRFPRLEWLNETIVIKQSSSVMICTFVSMGTVMLFAGIYSGVLYSVMPFCAYLAAFSLLLALLAAVFYKICISKGEKILLEL